MDKGNLAEKVREIAERAVENTSLELVHVEIVGAGKGQTVRVYIDKDEGINHDDCSAVSQAVEKELDERDLIPGSYVLEVSSPGIERGLYSLKDFERFKGNAARVRTHAPINGQKNFTGTILGTADDTIRFDDKTNGNVEIPFELVRKANLEFDLEQELKQAKKRRS